MSTSETNPFNTVREELFDDVTKDNSKDNPVDKTELFDVLADLESTGGQMIGSKAITLAQYSETMQFVYGAAKEVHAEPPISLDEQRDMTNKLAVLDAIVASTKP